MPYIQLGEYLRIQKQLEDRDELLEALQTAYSTIKVWHGDIGWEQYQSSPEIKKIQQAIAKSEEQ